MADYVSFEEVKQAVSIEDAAKKLGLKMKLNPTNQQSRGSCPACENAGERALVITPSKGFYCWGMKKSGDQIALASHVLKISAKEAANYLMGDRARTVPESEGAKGTDRSHHAQSFKPLDYLEADNEAVEALGLSPDFAKKVGIGYAGKGVLRGSVAIPLRDETGALLGYFGVQELTYIPPSFTPNVVPFEKKAS